MALISTENDEDAILRAEDEAIEAARHPVVVEPIPLGDDLAALIERVTNGRQDVQPDGAG